MNLLLTILILGGYFILTFILGALVTLTSEQRKMVVEQIEQLLNDNYQLPKETHELPDLTQQKLAKKAHQKNHRSVSKINA